MPRYFLFFLLYFSCIKESILFFFEVNEEKGFPLMSIEMGSQKFKVGFDTGTQYSWLRSIETDGHQANISYYDHNKSLIFDPTVYSYELYPEKYVVSNKFTDDLIFEKQKYRVKWLVTRSLIKNNGYDGIFGFPSGPSEYNNFSYKEKIMSYYHINNSSSLVSFGEYDHEIFQDRKLNLMKCQSDTSSEDIALLWNCKIKYTSHNTTLPANDKTTYAIFSTVMDKIYIPSSYEKVLEQYFAKKKDNCHLIIEEGNNLQTYTCVFDSDAANQIKKMDVFQIILENDIELFAFPFNLFTLVDNETLSFNIIIDTTLSQNLWYIGTPILKNFDYIFNYEDKTISFFERGRIDVYLTMNLLEFGAITVIGIIIYIGYKIAQKISDKKEKEKEHIQ